MEFPCSHQTNIIFSHFYISTFTWAEVVEVIVPSIRQVPSEGWGVNFKRRGGIRAQRKPPLEQILFFHPENLLLCRGEKQERIDRLRQNFTFFAISVYQTKEHFERDNLPHGLKFDRIASNNIETI